MKKYYYIEFGKDMMTYIDLVIEQIKKDGNHMIVMYMPNEKLFSCEEITEEEFNKHAQYYKNTK